jgi:hypothetical protein
VLLAALIVAICVILFVLAVVAPRMSRGPQRTAQKGLGLGGRGASKAPGPLGRLLSKPFFTGSRAAGKSAETGRRARGKLPL